MSAAMEGVEAPAEATAPPRVPEQGADTSMKGIEVETQGSAQADVEVRDFLRVDAGALPWSGFYLQAQKPFDGKAAFVKQVVGDASSYAIFFRKEVWRVSSSIGADSVVARQRDLEGPITGPGRELWKIYHAEKGNFGKPPKPVEVLRGKAPYLPGDKLQVKLEGEQGEEWHPAVVQGHNDNGTIKITWESDGAEDCCAPNEVKPYEVAQGTAMEVDEAPKEAVPAEPSRQTAATKEAVPAEPSRQAAATQQDPPVTPAKLRKVERHDEGGTTVAAVPTTSPQLDTPPKEQPTDQADEGRPTEKAAPSTTKEKKETPEGQRIYRSLLATFFRELDFYVEAETGYLDTKKQLLIYHHAAKMHELRESIVGALRGEVMHLATLPRDYQRIVKAYREECQLQGTIPDQEVLTAKNIFGHQYAIRWHQPPNVPQGARNVCIYIRERPTASSDTVLKRGSWFRDLIKFRCQGNPLSHIEDPGLGLIFNVDQVSPRAFLVLSPLLLQPQEVAEAAKLTWGLLEERLSSFASEWVAQDCETWRNFIQNHAHVVSKVSLQIIQKVLKGCRPTAQQIASAVESDAINALREEIEEKDQRISALEAEAARAREYEEADRAAEVDESLAFMEESVREAERRADAAEKRQRAMEEKMSARKEKYKAADDRVREVEHERDEAVRRAKAAEEQVSVSKSQADEACVEAERARAKLMEKAEEAEAWSTSYEKMENNFALLEEQASKDRKKLEKKREELEQVKQAKDEAEAKLQKTCDELEQASKAKAEAEANQALREELEAQVKQAKDEADGAVQKAREEMEEEVKQAREDAEAQARKKEAALDRLKEKVVAEKQNVENEKAQARERTAAAERAVEAAEMAHARTSAELKCKAEGLEALQASNVQLRVQITEAKECADQADHRIQAAERAAQAEREANAELETKLKAAERQKKLMQGSWEAIRAEAAQDQAAAKEQLAAVEQTLSALRDSSAQTQAKLQSQLVEKDFEFQASMAKKDECLAALENKVTAAKNAEAQARGELLSKSEGLERLLASNAVLRSETAAAKEQAASVGERVAAAERAAAAEASKQTEAALKAKDSQVQELKASCEALRAAALQEQAEAKERLSVSEQIASDLREASAQAQTKLQMQLAEKDFEFQASMAKKDECLAALENKVTAAKNAEAQARGELLSKSEGLERLLASNAVLRSETAAAKEQAASVDERVAAAERAAAAKASKQTEAALKAKDSQVKELEASCEALRAAALREQAEAKERLSVSEQIASDLREASAQAQTKLQLQLAEKDFEFQACMIKKDECLAALENKVTAAKNAEAQARGELLSKSEGLEQILACNALLRAETAAAKEQAASVDERVAAAERAAVAKASKQTEEALKAKDRQVKELEESCEALRAAALKEQAEAKERLSVSEQIASDLREASAQMQTKLQMQLVEKEAELQSHLSKTDERLVALDNALAAARQTEAQARGELQMKSDAFEHLLASNAQLRSETAAAKEDASTCNERVAAAERAAADAQEVSRCAESKLKDMNAQVKDLTGQVKDLMESYESQRASWAKTEVSMKERLAVAEQISSELRVSSARLQAESAAENSRLQAESALKIAEKDTELQQKLSQKDERLASLEATLVATEHKETQARAALQVKSEAADRLMASNTALRTEALEAKKLTEDAQKRAEAAEQAERDNRDLRTKMMESRAQARAELQEKISEVEKLTEACDVLRKELDNIKDNVTNADRRAAAAEKAAEASSRDQADTSARLQVKSAEVASLTNSVATLTSSVATLRAESDRIREQSAQAEKTLEERSTRAEKTLVIVMQERAQVRTELESTSRVARRLASLCEALKRRAATAEEHVESLTTKCDNLKDRVASAEEPLAKKLDADASVEMPSQNLAVSEEDITLDDIEQVLSQQTFSIQTFLPTAEVEPVATNKAPPEEIASSTNGITLDDNKQQALPEKDDSIAEESKALAKMLATELGPDEDEITYEDIEQAFMPALRRASRLTKKTKESEVNNFTSQTAPEQTTLLEAAASPDEAGVSASTQLPAAMEDQTRAPAAEEAAGHLAKRRRLRSKSAPDSEWSGAHH